MNSTHLLLAIVFLAGFASHAQAAQEPANVLLIITDEHNFRTLGCYRETMPREQAEMWGVGATVPTPNFDRLAAEGVLCTRAYATSPVCSPCRAAMITGRYPHATGVPTNNEVLDRSLPTLADRLNQAGYRTAFIGKWHLGGEGKPEWQPTVDGGFKDKRYMFNRGHWKKFILENGQPAVGARRRGKPNYNLDGADEETFSTDWLTSRTIDFVTDDSSQPFFAVVSYPDPHGPNTVRPPYDHRFDNLPFAPPRTYQTGIAPPKWLGGNKKHPVFRGNDMSRYFGMVQCLDDNLGRLFAELERAGQLDNTLIVMTSDHGDLCYEHDRQNKGNPYEGSARVPMIFRQPGRLPRREYYTQPVGTVDITPTIMGLLNLPSDPDDHGRDLSQELAAAATEEAHDGEHAVTFLRNSGKAAGWVAAVDSRYKLILSVSDIPWLFDAQQDPDELKNFYGQPDTQEVSLRLAEALRDYGQETQDPHLSHPKIATALASVLQQEERTAQKTNQEAAAHESNRYESNWKGSRRWIGPDWWANPLTDWSLRGGSAIATAAANRTLCLLTADLGGDGSRFELRTEIKLLPGSGQQARTRQIAAGFRIGRRGGIADYRHALVHATDWIDGVIRGDGKLALGKTVSPESLSLAQGPVQLRMEGQRNGPNTSITLTASQGAKEVRVQADFATSDVLGGISLLSHGPARPGGAEPRHRFSFQNISARGDLVKLHQDRSFGPILWSQYTLTGNRLRLQAQFAPLGTRPNHSAELWLAAEGTTEWQKVSTVALDKLSRTVSFTVDNWDPRSTRRYEVRFAWRGRTYRWGGSIRREPASAEPVKLACFSCDNGYLFPIPAMVSQVKRQDPDLMFFAGDQIYESYGGFGVARDADTPTAMLDYLRKYYQFGWTWRELLRDRPSIILPDDHDVFQGNLWGHGGRKLPDSDNKNEWRLGGYRMPGEWVQAIERTQVGHLPDPAVTMTLPEGIRPYFTQLIYGEIGFAILEDRKFKTGPLSLPEDVRTSGDGASLLGEEQEAFLRDWAVDWSGQRLKCALSQTIFCKAATHTGRALKRSRTFFDSGAWPPAARDRVVKILGDCNALSIHGDQHLGVLLRQGIDDFDDSGYAFMVPGTANGFPRAWWPGVGRNVPEADRKFTGRFRDDAGNPLNVLAVGNPEPGSNTLPKSTDPMEIGYRKGSGYGLVVFNKLAGTAEIALYRLGDQDEMFPGFPQTVVLRESP